jgi:hypothetical protein
LEQNQRFFPKWFWSVILIYLFEAILQVWHLLLLFGTESSRQHGLAVSVIKPQVTENEFLDKAWPGPSPNTIRAPAGMRASAPRIFVLSAGQAACNFWSIGSSF